MYTHFRTRFKLISIPISESLKFDDIVKMNSIQFMFRDRSST